MLTLKIIWLLAFLLLVLNLISVCKGHMGPTDHDDSTDLPDK